MSLVLRHRPDAIGLRLDEGGWADIAGFVEKARTVGGNLTSAQIHRIVATSDKQRFSISPDGRYIRANQGHTIAVELGLKDAEPPSVLYHGTARRNLAAIRSQGIRRDRRNHVHLSIDMGSAINVGARHGQPVVLRVASAEMNRAGFRFYRSENNVWLTEDVPPEYVRLTTSQIE